MNRALLWCLFLVVLSGCASPLFDVGGSETVLPLRRAWVDGRVVEYITTDASDREMARMMGVNFAPRLASAVGRLPGQSVLERVYKFEPDSQISVFQSGPSPVGPESADQAYSPLWRVVLVRWVRAENVRELRSEAQVLAAQDSNEVTLEVTGVVVNCPITRDTSGPALRGVR